MSWSTDRNGEGWFEKSGPAPHLSQGKYETFARGFYGIMRAALEEIANDPYQYGQRVQRMKRIAAEALEATASTKGETS